MYVTVAVRQNGVPLNYAFRFDTKLFYSDGEEVRTYILLSVSYDDSW